MSFQGQRENMHFQISRMHKHGLQSPPPGTAVPAGAVLAAETRWTLTGDDVSERRAVESLFLMIINIFPSCLVYRCFLNK